MNIGEKAKNFATSRSSPITQQKIDHVRLFANIVFFGNVIIYLSNYLLI